MLRAIFTIVAFLSLLLSIGSFVMWPVSHHYFTGVWVNLNDDVSIGIETYQGDIAFWDGAAGNPWWGTYHDPIDGQKRIPVTDASVMFKTIQVPLWLFGMILAVPPACWFWLVLTRPGRRRKRGACGRCGYDLRGNPDVAACPECGCPRHPPAARPVSDLL